MLLLREVGYGDVNMTRLTLASDGEQRASPRWKTSWISKNTPLCLSVVALFLLSFCSWLWAPRLDTNNSGIFGLLPLLVAVSDAVRVRLSDG